MRANWSKAARLATLACTAASALFAGSCGNVQNCIETEVGCLNGPPDDSGNCRFGLVPNAARTACVEKGSTTGGTSNTCNCTHGDLCLSNGMCSDLCTAPAGAPAIKDTPMACRPAAGSAAYDLNTALVALCSQICVHRAALCGATCNVATDCTPAKALVIATALKQNMACASADLECAMKACEEARDRPCDKQDCGVGNGQPNCAGVVCTNSCSTATFNNDGVCDDSDVSNADSALCAWGTDCGDCGPRRGAAPAFSVALGGACADPRQCGGDVTNVKNSTAWCVNTTSATNQPRRCVPDCSLSMKCQDGYECAALGSDPDGNGPMKPQPLMDSTGLTARACFPTQCGN